jgi:hypothetical protein
MVVVSRKKLFATRYSPFACDKQSAEQNPC